MLWKVTVYMSCTVTEDPNASKFYNEDWCSELRRSIPIYEVCHNLEDSNLVPITKITQSPAYIKFLTV